MNRRRQRKGLPDHPYLRAGDRVRLEVDGLGRAEQRFVVTPENA